MEILWILLLDFMYIYIYIYIYILLCIYLGPCLLTCLIVCYLFTYLPICESMCHLQVTCSTSLLLYHVYYYVWHNNFHLCPIYYLTLSKDSVWLSVWYIAFGFSLFSLFSYLPHSLPLLRKCISWDVPIDAFRLFIFNLHGFIQNWTSQSINPFSFMN